MMNSEDELCFQAFKLGNLINCSDSSDTLPPAALLKEAIEIVLNHDIGPSFEKIFWQSFNKRLRQAVVPKFWKSFAEFPKWRRKDHVADQYALQILCAAVNGLKVFFSSFEPQLHALSEIRKRSQKNDFSDDSVEECCRLQLRGCLLSQLPVNFEELIKVACSRVFLVFNTQLKKTVDDSGDVFFCQGCEKELDQCGCDKMLSDFRVVNEQLKYLGIQERLLSDVVTSIAHHRIEEHVRSTCQGNFENQYLNGLQTWLDRVVIGWLPMVYLNEVVVDGEKKDLIEKTIEEKKVRQRLTHHLHMVFTKLRLEQIFNIIIEFPESRPALLDLNICLPITGMRSQLIKSLRSCLENRVLHPGVNTRDILTTYMSTIKALKVLDSSGVLQELICEPVRKYLRTREDTVRAIIVSVMEEPWSDLCDEMGKPKVVEETCPSDEDHSTTWTQWMPDPVDADPTTTSRSKRTSDIFSMLVNIYGSNEVFVNEYQKLLADRLLSQFSFDTESDVRYLELLKVRFGESLLQDCDVMIKDVRNSKRINTLIQSDDSLLGVFEDFPVQAMVLSGQYWPAFREEALELPKIIQDHLDVYTKGFETLKGNRTLQWKQHLGQVELEVELKDRTLKLTVSPSQATIITHFMDKPEWKVADLARVMGMSPSVLRRRITYWQAQGVIVEKKPDLMVLMEELPSSRALDDVYDDEEHNSVMASASDQREEELNKLWMYITSMLTNLECLPLERIHSMLRMFATQGQGGSEFSQQDLRFFLDKKVRAHELVFSGGMYKLPKP